MTGVLAFVAGLFVAASVVYGSLAAAGRWFDKLEDLSRMRGRGVHIPETPKLNDDFDPPSSLLR